MSRARDLANKVELLNAITATASELNILDGATVTSAELNRMVESNTALAAGSDQITNVVSLTQAEYDALTPNASTLYMIVG